MAALIKYYLDTSHLSGVNAAVALYFIFGFFFTSTIECTAYVYGSEIWPTHLRSEGSTIAYASFFANAIAYSAPVAVALDNIGWKFYMVFVAVTVSSTIAIWLYFPEVSRHCAIGGFQAPSEEADLGKLRQNTSLWKRSMRSSVTKLRWSSETPWPQGW